MDTRPEFPQYYHVEDLYGNVFAVVCREHETSFTVIQKRDVRKSFIVSKVTNEAAVKELAPGQMLGASAHDYEHVLTKEFGFSLSPDVICYYPPEPERKADVERSIIEDQSETPSRKGHAREAIKPRGERHDDQDVQRGKGTDSAQSEQNPIRDVDNDSDGGEPENEQPSEPVNPPVPESTATDTGSVPERGKGTSGDAGKSDASAPSEPTNDAGSGAEPVQESEPKKSPVDETGGGMNA